MRDPSELQLIAQRELAYAVRAVDCEVRFTSEETGDVEGIALRFDTVDSYGTTFDRSAIVWRGERLPLLWSHNRSEVVGSVKALTVGSDGLNMQGRLNLEVQRAREIRAMLQAGDINGLSIGFKPLKAVQRGKVTHFTEVRLHEISFVAFPAVPGSKVISARSSSPHLEGFVRAALGAASSLRKDIK